MNGVPPSGATATSGTRRLAQGVTGNGGGGGLRYSGGVEEEAVLLREHRERGLQTDVRRLFESFFTQYITDFVFCTFLCELSKIRMIFLQNAPVSPVILIQIRRDTLQPI